LTKARYVKVCDHNANVSFVLKTD